MAKAEGFIEGQPLGQKGATGATGEHTVSVTIPEGMSHEAFKVTLVWTDLPGKLLVNDLDLIVKAGREERHGNLEAGDNSFDRDNNVEQVTWKNPPPGPMEITVRAYKICQLSGSKTQDYALAWKLF